MSLDLVQTPTLAVFAGVMIGMGNRLYPVAALLERGRNAHDIIYLIWPYGPAMTANFQVLTKFG